MQIYIVPNVFKIKIVARVNGITTVYCVIRRKDKCDVEQWASGRPTHSKWHLHKGCTRLQRDKKRSKKKYWKSFKNARCMTSEMQQNWRFKDPSKQFLEYRMIWRDDDFCAAKRWVKVKNAQRSRMMITIYCRILRFQEICVETVPCGDMRSARGEEEEG